MASGITSNLTSVLTDLRQHDKRTDTAINNSLDQAARTGVGMARKLVRVKTGALRASIDKKTISKTERHIGFGKWYGIIIEKGRKEIKPVNKKALFWKGLSHPVMKSKAYKGQPFMEPTDKYLKTYFPVLLKANVHKALN